MSELLSEEEIGNIVAGLRNGGKFADWPQHTALAFLRLVEAQRDHLKAQGWMSKEEVRKVITEAAEALSDKHKREVEEAYANGEADGRAYKNFKVESIKEQAVAEERKLLQACHDEMDRANAREGDNDKLCIYCRSNTYNASGIIHTPQCIISQVREHIAALASGDPR